MKDFNTFEQLFLELVGEFQTISASEARLREALRVESTRAEAAEAAKEVAERTAAEAKNSASAAAASATHAAAALSHAQEELTGLKIQIDLVERNRSLLEERCSEMSHQVSSLERELQQLRPLQTAHPVLQRQYVELQDRIRLATDDARKESSRLETELRRVERCANAGVELRERARLAAAAHVRERKLAADELQHTVKELQAAKSEVTKLEALVSELQYRMSIQNNVTKINVNDTSMAEIRAALEAERVGSARLEKALAAALADNAALAASVRACDNTGPIQKDTPITESTSMTNICAIDLFLAE